MRVLLDANVFDSIGPTPKTYVDVIDIPPVPVESDKGLVDLPLCDIGQRETRGEEYAEDADEYLGGAPNEPHAELGFKVS